jgi:hypothetical protein
MVPNGILINNPTLMNLTRHFLDFVIDNQDSSGWLGPEVFNTNKPRYLWGRYVSKDHNWIVVIHEFALGRYPFLFGAIQMVEYDPSLTNKVVTAMHKFANLTNTMLRSGQGLDIWTNTRWEDYLMALEWYVPGHLNLQLSLREFDRLYEYHPQGNEAILLDTMQRLKWSGDPWELVFATEVKQFQRQNFDFTDI